MPWRMRSFANASCVKRARFSQLTHPHICTLYHVGEHQGAPYLVLVPGRPDAGRANCAWTAEARRCADHIAASAEWPRRGAPSRRRAPRPQARQRHAHGRGSSEGSIDARLLDFGLAKQVLPPAELDSETSIQGPRTERGAILGTVNYMSPEQLRGEEADARSDIFAFGAMVYEMVAGRRPFEAGDSATLIAAILEHEPPPFSGLPTLPPRLERIVRVCLAKNPDDRWQSSRDLLRELQWTTESSVSPGVVTDQAAGKASRRWVVGALAAGMLVAMLGGWAWLGGDSATAANAIPVVVLMDSPHPARVYDPATLKAGGTNADDLTELLRDLPVKLLKETTGTSWRREDQVLDENPDLVVVHRSCFYDSTLLGDPDLDTKYFDQLYAPAAEKLEMFLAYVALANPRTRFVVYSRRTWATEEARDAWTSGMERRFPRIKGRLLAYKVPLDRATFRQAETATEIRELVLKSLAAERR